MIASATWKKDSEFEAISESGHSVLFDAGPDHSAGPSPMEAVLMALCGCTSVDVVAILGKKREPFTGLKVSATAEQAGAPPRVFTRIHLVYRVSGKVSHKAMEDAVSLSKNKYCSVSKMLEKAAEIDFAIEYEDEQAAV
ncbi:MAG TPA: OsmC family protein [Acidisarcina sp.]|nr:OsmC family protein [Acidisarcina sp.]